MKLMEPGFSLWEKVGAIWNREREGELCGVKLEVKKTIGLHD